MEMDTDEELLVAFIEEAKENIEGIYEAFEGFLESDNKSERLDAIYRGVHTLKGGSAIFKMNALKEEAHQLETRLTEYKGNLDLVDQQVLDDLRIEVDKLEDLLQSQIDGDRNQGEVESEQGAKGASANTTSPSDTDNKSGSTSQTERKPKNQEMIRVPVDRIQKNHDITTEIFLIRNQIAHLLEEESKSSKIRDEFFMQWEVLDNSLRQRIVELENIVLSMRMTPVKSLFTRMEKTVRTYCSSSSKKIDVNLAGSETEMDKKILDSLADPMIHLIRNAMDHGVEQPEDRVAVGKESTGNINLTAYIAGNEAVIEISDDGKGIDAKAILASAEKKGLDVSRVNSEQEMLQLIFAPGFSTAEQVSDVSGRGVGMDAVKTYIDKAGGKITIDTEIGSGTTFSLHLPIGLSVIPALILRVGDQLYGVPTHDIVATYTMTKKDISTNRDGFLVNLLGEFTPCVFLNDFFDNDDCASSHVSSSIFVCVANVNGRKLAFVADSIEANTELIVKPLPTGCPDFSYLNGVSILATGEPAFILSLDKLGIDIIESKKPNAQMEVLDHAS